VCVVVRDRAQGSAHSRHVTCHEDVILRRVEPQRLETIETAGRELLVEDRWTVPVYWEHVHDLAVLRGWTYVHASVRLNDEHSGAHDMMACRMCRMSETRKAVSILPRT